MDIVNKCLDKVGFKQYVDDFHFGSIPPNKIILHHTYRPSLEDWKGEASILGMKNYYENVKKWSAAPHIFIAPDGIWLFTPMNRVGIHAGVGNAGYYDKVLRRKVYGYRGSLGNGTWRYELKECSIGIEMVGDYDNKKPKGKVLDQTLFVIKTLMEHLNMKHDALSFHRDWYGANKSCPGWAVKKEWIYKELENYGKTIKSDVPKWFKENFVWDSSDGVFNKEQYNKIIEFLYKYHQKLNQ